MASQHVNNPKPMVKPAANEATLMSVVDGMVSGDAASHAQLHKKQNERTRTDQVDVTGGVEAASIINCP